MAASDVSLELTLPEDDTVVLNSSDLPDRPSRRISISRLSDLRSLAPTPTHVSDVTISHNDEQYKIELDCGTLQPGRHVWSEKFYIGFMTDREVTLEGSIFSANLPEPKKFALKVTAEVLRVKLSVKELVSLADSIPDES
jgi:hypothetical protein